MQLDRLLGRDIDIIGNRAAMLRVISRSRHVKGVCSGSSTCFGFVGVTGRPNSVIRTIMESVDARISAVRSFLRRRVRRRIKNCAPRVRCCTIGASELVPVLRTIKGLPRSAYRFFGTGDQE